MLDNQENITDKERFKKDVRGLRTLIFCLISIILILLLPTILRLLS